MSNLKLIDERPCGNKTIHPTPPFSKVVYKALQRNLPIDLVEEIINGYRRSKSDQDALIADYFKFDRPRHEIIKDEHYKRALNQLSILFFQKGKTKPVSFPDIRYYPWKLAASAEAPFTSDQGVKNVLYELFSSGINQDVRPTFHNLYNNMLIWNRQNVHRIKDGIYTDIQGRDLKYWNTAHARSHLVKSEEEDKIRMVFGAPKLLLMVECMFIWPMIRHLIEDDGPMLWGYETLKGGWYKIYNWASTYYPRVRTWLCFDWKSFDKTVSFTVLDDIHQKMRDSMDFSDGYHPTKDYPTSYTDPQRLERLWNWMREAMKHTPDLLPNGKLYQRQFSGLPSGFLQTQLTGSMYNALMMLTILSRMGINIEKVAIKVQGDDSIVGLNEYIPQQVHDSFMQQFSDYATAYFGAILNTKKSQMSNTLDGLPLLGFTNVNAYPVKGKADLLASLAHPEHQTSLPRLMARAIGIAWANCGNHSDVYRVCEDVFLSLEELGYTPDMKGLPDMIKSLSLMTVDSVDHFSPEFPSFYDTIKNLMTIHTRSKSQIERLWPQDHFLKITAPLSPAGDNV